jgi:hypothetical protein
MTIARVMEVTREKVRDQGTAQPLPLQGTSFQGGERVSGGTTWTTVKEETRVIACYHTRYAVREPIVCSSRSARVRGLLYRTYKTGEYEDNPTASIHGHYKCSLRKRLRSAPEGTFSIGSDRSRNPFIELINTRPTT